ncbi:MAG TPA: hypothetical protein VM487_07025 [Phycisphaerae bacterium]|nr:hypothetical protein [Phycisphaerae bacterium]
MANRDTHFETLLAQCRGPMTYTTPMVRRLREVPPGKTMTRRVITNLTQNRRGGWSWKRHAGKRTYYGTFGSRATEALREFLLNHARFAPGDLAYVAEGIRDERGKAAYVADGRQVVMFANTVPWQWKPSVLPSRFMRKEFARQILRIDEVRAERVQEITEADAIAEGFASRDEFLAYYATLYSKAGNCWNFVYRFHEVARR